MLLENCPSPAQIATGRIPPGLESEGTRYKPLYNLQINMQRTSRLASREGAFNLNVALNKCEDIIRGWTEDSDSAVAMRATFLASNDLL